nr:trigger factor [uncultured Catonella sp.]
MSVKIENLEQKNMVKLTIEREAKELDAAIDKVYHKQKNRIAVPGFRKGKAPLAMIEKMYGAEVFFEDAANEIIGVAYEEAAKESNLEIVSQPEIEVTQIEKGKPFIFTATVAIKPEVELGDYKGVAVPKTDTAVSEEELNNEIDQDRNKNARTIKVEDGEAVNGDETVIDFDGYVNGEQFDGGKSENYPLTLGSHAFIEGFEDQIVGHKAGDEFDVNVTFPEEYHAKSLAGKPATFKVVLKEIKRKELPELDDDFVQDVSEYNTVDEYKEALTKRVAERKASTAKNAKEEAAIDKVIEAAKMDIPEAMVESQTRQMAQDFANRIRGQGLSPEQYFQFTGMTPDTFMENLRPQALKRIQSRLVLEAVVNAENIEATEDDFNKELEEMSKAYNMELDKLKESIGEEEKKSMMVDIAVSKAVDFIRDSAVETEEAETSKKAARKPRKKKEETTEE